MMNLKDKGLSQQQILKIHYNMLLSRLLDEQLIQIYKKGQSYFWVGAVGEEAIGVSLGMLVRKGKGIHYDWLYLHYRCTGTMTAIGVNTKDVFRMMLMKKTDPFSQGKNFIHHYCIPEWNIPPITSTVEIQHSIAIGTAHAQSQESQEGITIVTGGDAGTALADFATALVWSSKPSNPLPLLIIVLNNGWGISTEYKGQHGESSIADRAKAFNIQTYCVNGNCPIESYQTLKQAVDYVRQNRKPALLEAKVSRLYGHSSASGVQYVQNEECCLKNFEEQLIKNQILTKLQIQEIRQNIIQKLKEEYKQVCLEKEPSGQNIDHNIFVNNENADWRKF